MAIPTAAISGVVTIASSPGCSGWRESRSRSPDGSLLVRYGKWMVGVGVACGVLMPLALVAFAVTAGFRNPEDPYYFGGMLLFFTLLGWWALLEGLKRRVAATDSGLVAHSPWRGEPVRFRLGSGGSHHLFARRWPTGVREPGRRKNPGWHDDERPRSADRRRPPVRAG